MAASSLRWGRIVLGGVLAELLLVAAIVPIQLAGGGDSAFMAAAVAGSFVAFVPVAWWLGRTLPRPVLHGVLMGAVAAVLYTLLATAGRYFNPDAPPMPLIYWVGHGLKLAGGGVGGWLAARSAEPAGAG